jgi:hypothetical protein
MAKYAQSHIAPYTPNTLSPLSLSLTHTHTHTLSVWVQGHDYYEFEDDQRLSKAQLDAAAAVRPSPPFPSSFLCANVPR